jgi:hypothetical protein
VIRDLKDFNNLILPVFYFIHGEEFDSSKEGSSYLILQTKKQINIQCKKCRSLGNTFNAEFEFLAEDDGPKDIVVHKRGAIFHSLHYEPVHRVYGHNIWTTEELKETVLDVLKLDVCH